MCHIFVWIGAHFEGAHVSTHVFDALNKNPKTPMTSFWSQNGKSYVCCFTRSSFFVIFAVILVYLLIWMKELSGLWDCQWGLNVSLRHCMKPEFFPTHEALRRGRPRRFWLTQRLKRSIEMLRNVKQSLKMTGISQNPEPTTGFDLVLCLMLGNLGDLICCDINELQCTFLH